MAVEVHKIQKTLEDIIKEIPNFLYLFQSHRIPQNQVLLSELRKLEKDLNNIIVSPPTSRAIGLLTPFQEFLATMHETYPNFKTCASRPRPIRWFSRNSNEENSQFFLTNIRNFQHSISKLNPPPSVQAPPSPLPLSVQAPPPPLSVPAPSVPAPSVPAPSAPPIHNLTNNEEKFQEIQCRDINLTYLVSREIDFEVYDGEWNQKRVSIKKHLSVEDEKKDDLKVQSLFQSQNIVKLYGFCNVNKEVWLVMEYTPLGNLHNLIHEQKSIKIDVCLKIQMLLDIADGMKYLHSMKNPERLHRDLKSANLIIFPNCTIKITNFINVRTLSSYVTHSCHKVGTELWMAPEILFADNDGHQDEGEKKNSNEVIYQYSKGSDVWSFSIVMYEVICRKLPFLGDNGELIRNLQEEKRPNWRKSYNSPEYEDLLHLMQRCWAQQFDFRPSFSDIYATLFELREKYPMAEIMQQARMVEDMLYLVQS